MLNEIGASIYQISVYHLVTKKRIRVLPLDYPATHMAFSGDCTALVSISDDGKGAYKLIYWQWLKQKEVSSAVFHARVTRVRINPSEPTQITMSGPGYFKQWRLNSHDDSLKASALLSGKNATVS